MLYKSPRLFGLAKKNNFGGVKIARASPLGFSPRGVLNKRLK
jgi:hypothetical protein